TFLSTGTGFQLASTSDICGNTRGSVCNDGDNHQYIFYPDINGDGIPDLVYRGDSGIQGWMQQDHTPQLIRMVDDGINRTGINYQPLTQGQIHTLETLAEYPILDLQVPLYVVTKVRTPDGLGGVNSINYRYGGLKAHLHGRGSLGFAWMKATNEQTGITTKTTYSQEFPFTGQVAATEQRLAGNTLLGRTEVTWADESSYDDKVHHVYTKQNLAKNYDLDGTLLATTTTDSLYDDYGNPTRITVTTTDDLGTETKDTLSDYTNDTDLWHLGRLTGATTTHSYGITQASITRTSEFTYNSDGLLSREIIEPDKPKFRKQIDIDYDKFGNKIKVTTSGQVTTSSQGITTRSSSTQYSTDGRFPVSVTNALGHSETRTYDPQLGVMTSLTGPNGLTTTWKYDSFGRQIREERADGTWSTFYRGMCGISDCRGPYLGVISLLPLIGAGASPLSVGDAPRGTVLYTTTESAGSTPTATYSNELGQVTRKATRGFDGTPVYQDTEYNALGQVSRSSLPYFKGEASHWSQTEYDILGRPTKVTQQGPSGTPIENSFSYSGFTTTVTNAEGHIKTTQKNAQGKVVRVDEEEGGWVTYQYDALGNLLKTDANGAIITLTYDSLGLNKIAMDDPDMGQWRYQYDILGNLIKQTDAKGQTVTQTYDLLDRMIKRVEPEGTTTWTYDSAANGIGKLAKVTAPGSYTKTLGYDSLGRATTVATTADGQTHSITSAYDEFSRVSKVTRPGDFVVENDYNKLGYLKAIRAPEVLDGWERDNDNDSVVAGLRRSALWRATGRDAAGRLTSSIGGNGLETKKHYDQATGQLMSITSAFGSAEPTRLLMYQYDSLNSVTSRRDDIQGLEESFEYDSLDRLTQSDVSGQIGGIQYQNTVDYSYDAQGNIRNKSDIGDYVYGDQERATGHAGPHALLRAGLNHTGYKYDDNGNLVQGGGRSITWSSFNKPTSFTKGDTDVLFKYEPDRKRYLKITDTSTTHYVGNVYERIESGSKVEHKHFIYADGQLVVINAKTTNNGVAEPDKTRYLHRDALGSIDTITDTLGNIVERMSYEPFGARRGGDWRVGTGLSTIPVLTNRGFTGHEHVDEMDLIHMNGRVYDPELGRFLSADPTMQDPYSSQGYNRYSYVHNNPLKYTDPSGYGFFKNSIVRAVVAIAAAAIVGPMVTQWATSAFFSANAVGLTTAAQAITLTNTSFAIGAIAGGGAAGLVAGGIITGSVKGAFKGAVFGAISGGMAHGIGHGFGLADNVFLKAVAHGVSQGAIGTARGGKFKASFLGAFVGHVVGGPIKSMMGKASVAARTTAAAIIGGVAAVAGGGKFANGAVSAAFTHLFNAENHRYQREKLDKNKWDPVGTTSLSSDGSSLTVDAGDKIAIELSSQAFPPTEKFYAEISARPIDGSGNYTGVHATQEWFEPIKYFGQTGQLLGVPVTTTFVLDAIVPGSYRWHINVPPQASTHDNSAWQEVNVYVPK
ncbi:MAG: RHS repeat-associated core domain-containing protein, partial [Candidatus Sedimenticola sp. (ex Thyasira tokunagai)]